MVARWWPKSLWMKWRNYRIRTREIIINIIFGTKRVYVSTELGEPVHSFELSLFHWQCKTKNQPTVNDNSLGAQNQELFLAKSIIGYWIQQMNLISCVESNAYTNSVRNFWIIIFRNPIQLFFESIHSSHFFLHG